MTSPKKRSRARRRVERTMEEALEAAASGRLALADKLSRRAVEAGFVNPRIWRDRGRVARICRDDDAAEQAFRRAIAIAPTYASAFTELGRLQAERGRIEAAERLLRRAVELDPDDVEVIAEHARMAARLGTLARDSSPDLARQDAEPPAFTARTGRFDWPVIQADLEACGAVRLAECLDAGECRSLVDLADLAECVDAELVRDDEQACASIRFLRVPLPAPVSELRGELYARLAPVANAWQERLGRDERFPPALDDLSARCGAVGQVRSEVALVQLGDGGFVAPVAGPRYRITFPFRAAVSLGPGGAVQHVLHDIRPGRRTRERQTELRPGDALVACDRQRLVRIAGVDGLQEVTHGFAQLEGARSAVLMLPFVEGG